MRIDCPHCGPRPSEEFTMKGDASPTRPAPGGAAAPGAPAATSGEPASDWHLYVYLRENPMGRLAEYWHHSGGCRAWLVVERDTVTHEVFSVATASDHAKSKSGS